VFDEDRIDLGGIWHTTLLGIGGGMVGQLLLLGR